VCAADLYIANGATENDMRSFYESRIPTSKDQALAELGRSFDGLKSFYLPLNERQLLETHAAYWGVNYSRFEWLLETL
ncbi:DinB family protein, partial [Bacillus sp. SIMBA_161]